VAGIASSLSRSGPSGLNFEKLLIVVLVTTSLFMIVAATFLSASAPRDYSPALQVPIDSLPPTPAAPGVDTDGDSLFDIDENYIYGTDTQKVDTDADGMPDPWEVRYKDARNPDTRELLIDPVDATDAYEDPDQDGYDYNNNGRIDTYQDSVVRANLSIPAKAQYEAQGVCAIAQRQLDFDGKPLHLERVTVMDNGTYSEGATNPSTEINIRVLDSTTTQQGALTYIPLESCAPLRVILEPGSNRPPGLVSWNKGPTGEWLPGADLVNIEGIFHVDPENPNAWWLTVRGGEGFPNIQEYQTWRDYFGDGNVDGADPLARDTDGDGMWDGFEAHYGKGLFEPANGTFVWKWNFFMSPVNTSDAVEDPDNDGIRITWQEKVNKCLLRFANLTCVREVPEEYSPGDFVLAGNNLDEFYIHTRPDLPDTDNDTFPRPEEGDQIADWNTADMQEYLVLGTSPILFDTDGDGMDDGWEVFNNLLPQDPKDKFEDPDLDDTPNWGEYSNPGCFLDPHDPDTDSDGMADGWEVRYQLDACRNDAGEDVDLTRGVITPDGLTNIEEYAVDTNPRRVDTDGDFLSDYDEVRREWSVVVEGQTYTYKTRPSTADTDVDDFEDDEDGDGNFGPCEEILDGLDNDGDAEYQQLDGIDNDGDGVIDDGPFGRTATAGIPGTPEESWLAEGVDEEHDMCDWNEVNLFHTNASNPDTDLEGLTDWVELFTDRNTTRDGMQTTNPLLKDTDGDRLDDYSEVPHLDGALETCLRIYLPGFTDAVERCTDPLNPDTDGDSLEDGLEVLTDFLPFQRDGQPDPIINSTDPTNADTDGDGLSDGYEFDNSDIDGDGLPTRWELDMIGVFPLAYVQNDTDENGRADVDDDWDGDGLTTIQEYQYRFNPFDPDTDKDNTVDGEEKVSFFNIPRLPVYQDSDGDFMPDWWERLYGFDPRTPAAGCSVDSDNDGFKDLDEYLYNTNPRGSVDASGPDKWNHPFVANIRSCDSDGDGIADWWEEFYELDPQDPTDADRNLDKELNETGELNEYGIRVLADNWTNFDEYIYARDPYNHISTNPREGDSDFDAWILVVRSDGSFNVTQGLKQKYDSFYTDDADTDPMILWHFKRPVNPSAQASALSPVISGDAGGDIDRDGVNNTIEAQKSTSAFDPDTDGDGMPDGWEIQYAVANLTTGKPILDPLYPDDAHDDPDNDGWNYSRIMDDNRNPTITKWDFDNNGILDNFLDNEQFSNLEEYWFGDDVDGDGINEQTTNPGKKCTTCTPGDPIGIADGYLQYFRDRDFDQMPRWFEAMFSFNDADFVGPNGGQEDADLDGAKNVIEARAIPWTNPRDATVVPPECSWPREFLPDPSTPPAGWPC
jgi:hypothetical protein